jgi:hypothetical protein
MARHIPPSLARPCLFRREKGLDQLADIWRVQGIDALAVDALIFSAAAVLLKQRAQDFVALRTDSRLGHGRSETGKVLFHGRSLLPKLSHVKL